MTIDTDAVMVFAAMVFAACMIAYIGLFVWSRRMDRVSRRATARFERELDELLRR